jgi:hypothetical protein
MIISEVFKNNKKMKNEKRKKNMKNLNKNINL